MTPAWPRACTAPLDRAVLKATPEHFRVCEVPAVEPCGAGEHLWLLIRKTALGTPQVVDWLARGFAVPRSAVGYAGMKDRQAVTEQWFSVHTRAGADALAPGPGIEVRGAARHARKLRRGDLAGNRFSVRMTGVRGERWAERLGQVSAGGAPNYFGAQRFGRDNLGRARAWLGERRRRRTGAFRAGLYRSVLRSFLFNEVLAARVAADTWNARLPGDVTAEPGDPSGMAPPTGPLWGRGRSPASDAALAVEQAALAPHGEIREGLEHAGLRQERRALVLRPRALTWAQDGASVDLAFELPPGTYATALLAEVFDLTGAAEAAP